MDLKTIKVLNNKRVEEEKFISMNLLSKRTKSLHPSNPHEMKHRTVSKENKDSIKIKINNNEKRKKLLFGNEKIDIKKCSGKHLTYENIKKTLMNSSIVKRSAILKVII